MLRTKASNDNFYNLIVGVTGKGICYFMEGTVYKGDWKDNAVHGQGVCCFSDGNRYDGEWKMGKKGLLMPPYIYHTNTQTHTHTEREREQRAERGDVE